jgi:branched-chain amino acid transport system ATP-binding protein
VSNNNVTPVESSLVVSDLTAGYAAGPVLFQVSFSVPSIGTTALVGRNGAGKTTLLRSIMGYQTITAGQVWWNEKNVTKSSPSQKVKGGIGYVPQDTPVFPELTVRDNLLMGLGAAPKKNRSGIDMALDIFPKLADRLTQKAGTMSGGERKMVGIARAILGQPSLLIMDEPTEGVWIGVVDEIQVRLREYAREHAILLVEQNLEFALDLASKVLVLERGEIVLEGTPQELADQEALKRFLTI